MVDSENFAHVLDNFPEQIREAASLGQDIKITVKGSTIIICGMGGSGLPGEIIKRVAKTPVILVKDYTLPKFVSQKDIVIAVSYSGNTEETLELYDQAKKKGVQLIAVASGGQLAERAKKDNRPLIVVPVPDVTGPSGFQPRMAGGYQTIPLMNLLQDAGIEKQNWNKCATFLEEEKKSIKALAKKMAEELDNRTPLIYSSEAFFAAAFKWKINVNENAKMHAFCNFFPEWNHNEINAHAKENNYHVFILRDEDDHPRIKQRMSIVSTILKKKQIRTTVIDSRGTTYIERLFWTIYVGDWLSYFVALAHGVDPTPVNVIEDLKKALNQTPI